MCNLCYCILPIDIILYSVYYSTGIASSHAGVMATLTNMMSGCHSRKKECYLWQSFHSYFGVKFTAKTSGLIIQLITDTISTVNLEIFV